MTYPLLYAAIEGPIFVQKYSVLAFTCFASYIFVIYIVMKEGLSANLAYFFSLHNFPFLSRSYFFSLIPFEDFYKCGSLLVCLSFSLLYRHFSFYAMRCSNSVWNQFFIFFALGCFQFIFLRKYF